MVLVGKVLVSKSIVLALVLFCVFYCKERMTQDDDEERGGCSCRSSSFVSLQDIQYTQERDKKIWSPVPANFNHRCSDVDLDKTIHSLSKSSREWDSFVSISIQHLSFVAHITTTGN